MPVRPRFVRTDKFVVVKRIRLSADTVIEVGETISINDFPRWRLLRWYKRRKIAQFGSAWVNHLLKPYGLECGKQKVVKLKTVKQKVGGVVEPEVPEIVEPDPVSVPQGLVAPPPPLPQDKPSWEAN